MAIFKPPKIKNEALLSTVLLKGEIVYNEDNGKFYTGDDVKPGGLQITGPVAEGQGGSNVTVPTKLSELENDCNFISGYTEEDGIFAEMSGTFATKDDLNNLATTAQISEINDYIASSNFAPMTALNDYVMKNDNNYVEEAALSGYATKAEIENFITEAALTGFASVAALDALATKAEIENFITEDALSGYATKAEIENFVTEDALTGYVSKDENPDSITVSSEIVDNTDTTRTVFSKLTSMSFELTADSVFGSSKLPSTEFDNKMFIVNVGVDNTISGFATTVIGKGNTAVGAYATTIGYGNFVYEAAGFAHGHNNEVRAGYGHAEGQSTKVLASYGHSEGCGPVVSGQWAHAEGGEGAIAGGEKSHAEGRGHALGEASHAEGLYAVATGTAAHAEGNSSSATGTVSHAEGISTNASGEGAHTEGLTTWADGKAAHAEGYATHADFEAAHAEGNYTSVAEKYQHVEGAYNVPLTGYQHIVGGGDETNGRKNIQTLDWNGNEWNAGTVAANDIIFNGDAQTLLAKLAAMEARITELEAVTSGMPRTTN